VANDGPQRHTFPFAKEFPSACPAGQSRYISERVKELTSGKQTPTTAKPQTVPDFPVALKQ